MTHVIVGAGEAGIHAALAQRQNGYRGRLLLIGAERHLPYTRPPLSKRVLVDEQAVVPEIASQAVLAEKGIEFRSSTRVAEIDARTRTLSLGDGSRQGYDNLVLATGCRARRLSVPVQDPQRVHYLRSFDDALEIRSCFRPGARLALIGGGYIGLEIAASARRRGCVVTVIEQAASVMTRVVGAEMARFLTELHTSNGVKIHTGVRVASIENRGEARVVRCEAGEEFEADIVVAGIGAEPCTELAQTANLQVDDGIVVDEFGRSSDPHIFACGDVANHPNASLGRRIRLESWQNAQQQAACVGATLAGQPRPYSMVPWFWSDQYDVNLQMIGFPVRWDETVVRGSPAEKSFTVIYLDRGVVVAANAVNRPKDIAPARSAIEKRVMADRGILQDPTVPLQQAFKAHMRRIQDVA